MLIEKAEFLSKQGALKSSFSFDAGRLNLIYTDAEQSKDDFFSAISELLFPELAPESPELCNELRESILTLSLENGQLTLFKDFESGRLECRNSEGEEGEGLPGSIQSRVCRSLFLVAQDEGALPLLSDRQERLSVFSQFETLSESTGNVERAQKVLEEKLDKYPFRGKNYKIDDLLNGLTRGKVVLEERLMQLELEREEAGNQIDELKKLEDDLEQAQRVQKREEYFQLCLETAELDARIMKVQQRLMHEAELKKELEALSDLSDFPISGKRKVQELWTMRQARLSDLERHDEDLVRCIKEVQQFEEIFKDRAEGLDQFSIEDSQELYSLSKNLQASQEELEQLQIERAKEMRRVKKLGVDFDSISLLRKSVLEISPDDIEESNRLAAELKMQKDRLSNLVELSQNTSKQLQALSEEVSQLNLKSRKIRFVLISLATVSVLIVLLVSFVQLPESFEVFATIFQTSFVLAVIALFLLPPIFSNMRKEIEGRADAVLQQQNGFDRSELDLSNVISKIQESGDKIASNYKFESSAELFKKLQTYGSVANSLKQLDFLDTRILEIEASLAKIGQKGMEYLSRVGRKTSIITPPAFSVLASEILWHKESMREFERASSNLNHRKSERRYLEGEIRDIDAVLKDYFVKARLEYPDQLEKSFVEFEAKAQDYKKWESISQELKRIEKDRTSEILDHDLSTLFNKLQQRRTDAWSKMQDLILNYPDILSETLEDEEIGRLGQGDAEGLLNELNEKHQRADSLRQALRAAAKNFDEFHPRTQHELELLERDLQKIRRDRSALILAKDSLQKVASKSKSSWSSELGKIAEEMLAGTDLEIKKVSWDENMELLLTLKDQDEPVPESLLGKKTSRALRKQVNWLIRLMLCRYISNRISLPLVLDEPFCDLDDKRFASCMNLLIEKILPHCQLIILTCQQVRHKWFLESLENGSKEKVNFV